MDKPNTLADIEHSICFLRLFEHKTGENGFIGNGTGFFWQDKEDNFLISNWHVFSGRKPNKAEEEYKEKIYLEISYHTLIGWHTHPERILICENKKPNWIQHPKNLRKNIPSADVAILHLPKTFPKINALNTTLKNKNTFEIITEPTMQISILGYPFLPDEYQENKQRLLWVSGYIAEFHSDEKLDFLVNAFPYEGMSGSPVFWIYQNRPIKLHPKGALANGVMGDFVQFLGIYSGRRLLNDNNREYPAPMAVVWKPKVIEEILQELKRKLNF